MVDGYSMGPGLQLVGARFSNFLPGKLSREFKLRRMSIFHDIQMTNGHILVMRDATVTWLRVVGKTLLAPLQRMHAACQSD